MAVLAAPEASNEDAEAKAALPTLFVVKKLLVTEFIGATNDADTLVASANWMNPFVEGIELVETKLH